MDKFQEFYTQTMTNDAVRAEVKKIIGKTPVNEATDEQLIQLGELAKTLGLDFSLEEVKAYFGNEADDDEVELSSSELQAVAGGKWHQAPLSKNPAGHCT